MKRYIHKVMLIVCAGVAYLPGAVAQETSHRIMAGLSEYSLEDEIFGQSSEGSKALSFEYKWQKRKEKRIKSFSTGWQKTSFTVSGKKLKLNDFNLRYADAFLLFKSSYKRFSAFVGYSITTNPSFRNLDDDGKNNFTWNTLSNLNLCQTYRYQWKRHAIELEIDLPLLGLASRPAANAENTETSVNGVLYNSYSDLFFTSLHNYRAVSLSLAFIRSLSPHLQLQVGYKYTVKNLQSDLTSYDRISGIHVGLVVRNPK